MSEQKRRPGRYPAEVRERAVRMVFDHQHEYPSQWKAIESISAKLSINMRPSGLGSSGRDRCWSSARVDDR